MKQTPASSIACANCAAKSHISADATALATATPNGFAARLSERDCQKQFLKKKFFY